MKDLLRSESRFWALVEDTWKRKGAHGGTLFLGTCLNFTRWDHLGIIDSCPFPKGSATATTATKQRLPFSLQRPPPALSLSSLFYCSYSLIIVRDIQGPPAELSIRISAPTPWPKNFGVFSRPEGRLRTSFSLHFPHTIPLCALYQTCSQHAPQRA